MGISPEQLTGAVALCIVLVFCVARHFGFGRRQFFDARREETRAARSEARAHLARGRPARAPGRRWAGSHAALFRATHARRD